MSDRYDRYDGWASLYDDTVGPEYGRQQLALLEREVLPGVPSRADLLDLCCGTGQLLAALLERGHRVTGLDSSEDMLARAARNAPGAQLLLADARDFDAPRRFDAVFSTSASLNHVEELADLERVFRNVFEALRKGCTFVFDLNHPGQLEKWWRGYPTEGAIDRNHAWYITPHYSPDEARGDFTVTTFRRPEDAADRPLGRWFRPSLYRVLSRPRFIGLRLKLLSSFARVEPSWERADLEFPIRGHDVADVTALLSEVGFDPVRVETIDGQPLDDDHSAHFMCQKPWEGRA